MCAVYANVLRGGTNSFQTEAADLAEFMHWTMSDGIPPIGTIAAGTPVTGDFAVQAQASPNKTVKVKAGKILVKATPTSESERLFTVTLSADTNVTLADNTTGSTRYDVIYVTLPADALHDPAATGDLTEAACILAERHTAAGVALTATNAIPIAEITVANGFSSIANAVIADKRKYAQSYGPHDWNPILGTISCGSTNVITVPAGALKRVSIGDKIWCKDDGVEFMGYAVAITDTTVTVKGGTTAGVGADIAASSVITELYYSKAASPVGFTGSFKVLDTAGDKQWFSMSGADMKIYGYHIKSYTSGDTGVKGESITIDAYGVTKRINFSMEYDPTQKTLSNVCISGNADTSITTSYNITANSATGNLTIHYEITKA